MKLFVHDNLINLLYFKVSVLFSGGSIGFYSGDMRLFNDDIRLLKPTMIPAVPNVLNRMYDKVSISQCFSTLSSAENIGSPKYFPGFVNMLK
jgi:hypothetical protein